MHWRERKRRINILRIGVTDVVLIVEWANVTYFNLTVVKAQFIWRQHCISSHHFNLALHGWGAGGVESVAGGDESSAGGVFMNLFVDNEQVS